ncbi:unnamed protein product [Parnassius apollo]|uniref:(apollo) hypothetical protein n=1 Tax=Parnassius apollo TaxID=110799 RepID=A0A8S3WCD9_PARAO|nr:unnamed protein product [Parnassius apollo]
MESMLTELTLESGIEFSEFLRMSTSDFEIPLQELAPLITKKDTKLRKAIPTKVWFCGDGDGDGWIEDCKFGYVVTEMVMNGSVTGRFGSVVTEMALDGLKTRKFGSVVTEMVMNGSVTGRFGSVVTEMALDGLKIGKFGYVVTETAMDGSEIDIDVLGQPDLSCIL